MAAVLLGRMARSATIEVPGGALQVIWRESDAHVLLTGPTTAVYHGTFGRVPPTQEREQRRQSR